MHFSETLVRILGGNQLIHKKIDLVSSKHSLLVHLEATNGPQNLLQQASWAHKTRFGLLWFKAI